MTPGCAPPVSLIVITRNHERYIDEALNSVSNQTLKDFQVVVVDDASTDDTPARIRTWRDRAGRDAHVIFNERNLGICASRNRALRACRGEFLAALSGDDYYEPRKLEQQLEMFATLDASVAAVFGKARVVNEQGAEIGVWFEHMSEVPEGRLFDRLLQRNFLPAPTVMIRRAAIEEVGGYDESLFFEDYDMWLRLADRYDFRYLPEILVNYRLHDSSTSRNPAYYGRMNESRVRILLKWLGRSGAHDAVAIAGAWRFALGAFAADAALGRPAMQRVCAARPSLMRRALLLATRVPGSEAAAAAVFGLVMRRLERRRYTRDGRVILP